MRLADYVADFVAAHAARIYGVCGAGAMHLNDAFGNHPTLEVIPTHHEQAATYAAEAEARVTNAVAFVTVTTGPGATNAVTGVACAYVDSIPLFVIGGQVPTATMVGGSGLRQKGMNELDGAGIMQPITKCSNTVHEPFMIRYHLEHALHLATTGRRGPVFLEIPLNVQSAEVEPANLIGYDGDAEPFLNVDYVSANLQRLAAHYAHKSFRPAILVGNGVRLAGAEEQFRLLVDKLNIPVVTSWGAVDLLSADHHCHIGHCGLFGDRASNWVMQNCDLLICIGTRLSPGQIGHHPKAFAPNAFKVLIDIDQDEVEKVHVGINLPIVADAKMALKAMRKHELLRSNERNFLWTIHCQMLKRDFPVAPIGVSGEGVNAYEFVRELSGQLDDDAIIVTDVGFCYLPTFQSLKLRGTQRLIHSHGVSPMGWGIPAAIGAAFAAPGRQVVCLTGDGGAMMNIQELQTIAHHDLKIAIFVFYNGGYATMRLTQNHNFGREVMSGRESGVSVPDFTELANAFNIMAPAALHSNVGAGIESTLSAAKTGPVLRELMMTHDQAVAPRILAKKDADGNYVAADLADMWPHDIKLPSYHNVEEENAH